MSGDSLFGNGEYIPAPSISSQNDRKGALQRFEVSFASCEIIGSLWECVANPAKQETAAPSYSKMEQQKNYLFL